MLVIQIVPEDVHSKWHLNYKVDNGENTGIWLIEDSEWQKSFTSKYLENKQHYIVSFSHNIVEVLCEDLIFGSGEFDIEHLVSNDERFAGEYLYRAYTHQMRDNWEEAGKDFERYLAHFPNGSDSYWAKKGLENSNKYKGENSEDE